MSIGEWVRTTRKALGYSQQQLADACAVTQPTVSSWERGLGDIDRHQIASLCKLFGLDDDECLRAMRLPVSLQVNDETSQEAA